MKLFSSFTILVILLALLAVSSSSVFGKRIMHEETLHIHPLKQNSHYRGGGCPCPSNPSLCAPLKTPLPEKEYLMFQTNSTNWKTYDFRYVTSIALFNGYQDPTMLCYAHEHGVRILYATSGVPPNQLTNVTARSTFIDNAVKTVQENFWDGINLDFEFPLPKNSPQEEALTLFTHELSAALKKAVPTSSFSMDVAWSSNNIDGRAYNYNSLIQACDFVAIMDYDTRSQVFTPGNSGPCWAGPNSPADTLFEGVASYLRLPSASRKKLVLGLPWYGYRYECLNANSAPTPGALVNCEIKSVPFRNVSCSDAAGAQIIFSDIMKISRNDSQILDPVFTNTSMKSNGSYAVFNYYQSISYGSDQPLYKMYFDNPATLGEKCAASKDLGLRGIAIWSVDMLYIDPVHPQESAQDAKEMWEALGRF